MTLVELLVVIFILLAVTAAAIPVVFPALQNRRVRESSRLVTSYFAGARDRAMRSGRSTGVQIERFEGQPEMAIVLTEVEVQAPYAGDFVTSRIVITSGRVSGFAGGDVGWRRILRLGDQIKLNYQGHVFTITNGPTGSDVFLGREDEDNNGAFDDDEDKNGFFDEPMDQWLLFSETTDATLLSTPLAGVPFQVFRQPAKTARPPLVLPESIAIDLVFSGDAYELFVADTSDTGRVDATPVIIMFSPTGSVDRVYHSVLADHDNDAMTDPEPVLRSHRLTGPIHFLLGRREKIPLDLSDDTMPLENRAVNDVEQNNLLDLTNIWITIQPQTGHIASTENSPIIPPNFPMNPLDPMNPMNPPDLTRLAPAIAEARLLASEGQGMGGR